MHAEGIAELAVVGNSSIDELSAGAGGGADGLSRSEVVNGSYVAGSGVAAAGALVV